MLRHGSVVMSDDYPPFTGGQGQHLLIVSTFQSGILRGLEIDSRLAASDAAHDRLPQVTICLDRTFKASPGAAVQPRLVSGTVTDSVLAPLLEAPGNQPALVQDKYQLPRGARGNK